MGGCRLGVDRDHSCAEYQGWFVEAKHLRLCAKARAIWTRCVHRRRRAMRGRQVRQVHIPSSCVTDGYHPNGSDRRRPNSHVCGQLTQWPRDAVKRGRRLLTNASALRDIAAGAMLCTSGARHSTARDVREIRRASGGIYRSRLAPIKPSLSRPVAKTGTNR